MRPERALGGDLDVRARAMKWIVATAIISGCRGTEPAPVAAGDSPAPARAPDPAPAPADPPAPSPAAEPEPEPTPAPAADDCVATCIERRQMQAVAIDVIERDCARTCAAQTEPAPLPEPDAACKAAAAKARKSIESGPMRKRAPKVFGAVGDAKLSCGVASPLLEHFAEAGAKRDLTAREAALRDVLARDPDFSKLCPAGPTVLDEVADEPERERVAWIAKTCPIDDPHAGEAVYRDVGPMTYLAITAIAAHWAEVGATTGDHEVILNVARLASALERDAQR